MALQRKSFLARTPLKRGRNYIGPSPRSIKYQDFRNLKAVKDRDENGLLHCQDYLLGLPRCNGEAPNMDLHHGKGRDGDLLFDERYLVWLVRNCHDAAHSQNSRLTLPEAPNDAERQVEERPRPPRPEETEAPRSSEVSPVQRRPSENYNRHSGRTIFSSVQRRNAEVVVREKEGSI